MYMKQGFKTRIFAMGMIFAETIRRKSEAETPQTPDRNQAVFPHYNGA